MVSSASVVETSLLEDDRRLRIQPYKGESQIDDVMALIDEELSEPYTVYTYRYFLNQWPSLCFLAYVDESVAKRTPQEQQQNGNSAKHKDVVPLSVDADARPIGVVIGKLDRHLKGKRHVRGYIGMISVRSSLRGRGIAKRLLHVVLAQMVAQGAQEIVLETEIDNDASLRLYEGFGFIREKRLFNFYLNGKDCFRLIIEIPPTFVSHHQQQEQQAGLPSVSPLTVRSRQPPPPLHPSTRRADIL